MEGFIAKLMCNLEQVDGMKERCSLAGSKIGINGIPKAKWFLCLLRLRAIKTYGEVEVQLHRLEALLWGRLLVPSLYLKRPGIGPSSVQVECIEDRVTLR